MSDREQFRCDRMCGANQHGVCGTNGVPAFLMTLPGLGIRKKRGRPLSTITPAVSARADAPWSPVCLPSGRSHKTRLLDSAGVTAARPQLSRGKRDLWHRNPIKVLSGNTPLEGQHKGSTLGRRWPASTKARQFVEGDESIGNRL